MPTPHDAYTFLRDRMAAEFSWAELAALCEDVGVRPDHLPHGTTPELARGLLQWAAPHPDRRADLIARLRALRPTADWPDDYAAPTANTEKGKTPSRSPNLSAQQFEQTDETSTRPLLSTEDRRKITELILDAKVVPYEPNGRMAFLDMCDLGFLGSYLPMSGTPYEFVTSLVARSASYGLLKSGRHALEVLLDYLSDLPATPRYIVGELSAFIAIILKHDINPNLSTLGNYPLSVTPTIRYKMHVHLINLGKTGIENYAFYFGVDMRISDVTDINSAARFLLERIEKMGMSQQLLEILKEASPNDFGIDRAVSASTTSAPIYGDKTIRIYP